MVRLTLLLGLLLIAPALAQGPAPGHDTAADYATAYIGEQTDNASADPAAYAQSKATPSAIGHEVAHSAYMACWATYDATGTVAPGCEAYFTPPVAVDPQPEAADEGAVAETEEFAAEALTTAQDIVADPASTPEEAAGLVASAIAFVLGLLSGIGVGVAAAASATVAALLAGIMAIVDSIAAMGAALGTGLNLGLTGLQTASVAVMVGAASGAEAIGKSVVAAAAATVDFVAELGRSLFASAPESAAAPNTSLPSTAPVDDGGLLDSLTGLLD